MYIQGNDQLKRIGRALTSVKRGANKESLAGRTFLFNPVEYRLTFMALPIHTNPVYVSRTSYAGCAASRTCRPFHVGAPRRAVASTAPFLRACAARACRCSNSVIHVRTFLKFHSDVGARYRIRGMRSREFFYSE